MIVLHRLVVQLGDALKIILAAPTPPHPHMVHTRDDGGRCPLCAEQYSVPRLQMGTTRVWVEAPLRSLTHLRGVCKWRAAIATHACKGRRETHLWTFCSSSVSHSRHRVSLSGNWSDMLSRALRRRSHNLHFRSTPIYCSPPQATQVSTHDQAGAGMGA